MKKELRFAIKSSDGKYWKKDSPFWVDRVIHATSLKFEEGQDKIEELEKEVDFLLELVPANEERKKTEN